MNLQDWLDRAEQFKAAEDWEAALEAYQQALPLAPDAPVLYNNMGVLSERLDQLDQAEAHYRTALRLDPSLAITYSNLGSLYVHQGRSHEAKWAFEACLWCDRDRGEVAQQAQWSLLQITGALYQKCSKCGCVSKLPQYFQQVNDDMLCPRCAPEPDAGRWQPLKIWLSFLALPSFIAATFGALWLYYAHPYLFFNLLLLLLCAWLMILVHPLVQALVAKLLGGNVYELFLGVGPVVWEMDIAKLHLFFRRYPVLAGILFAFPSRAGIWVRTLLVFLTGMLVHLLPLLALAPGFDPAHLRMTYAWRELFVIANGALLLFHLLPWKISRDGRERTSEGLSLLRLIKGKYPVLLGHLAYFLGESQAAFRRKDYARVVTVSQEGMRFYPGDMRLQTMPGLVHMAKERYDQALAHYQGLLARLTLSMTNPPSGKVYAWQIVRKAELLSFTAYVALHTELDGFGLNHAYDEAREAFLLLPWSPDVALAWGLVLVETGAWVEGVRRLLDVYNDAHVSSKAKAEALAYAALGFHYLGKPEDAQTLLDEALSLDSKRYLVQKAQAEIQVAHG